MKEKTESLSGSDAYHDILHRKMLIYAITVSVIALPIGLLLRMPIVWVLALAGVLVGGVRLWARRNRN